MDAGFNPASPAEPPFLQPGRPFARASCILLALVLAAFFLTACSDGEDWHGVDMKGGLPDLQFTMTSARDAKPVTQADFRGTVTLLYFGYTYCPDVCPLTLTNVAQVLGRLGERASAVRVLFVTVDPDRDTLDLLANYIDAFAPQFVGLRGTGDQLAALAKRYRVAYSVERDAASGAVSVTHSSAIYAFDRQGRARLLFTGFATPEADIDGMAADLGRLIDEQDDTGWRSWLEGLV